MLINTPKFWQKRNLISYLLWPLSFAFAAFSALHKLFFIPKKVDKPVICIGNLTMGGSGKTPVALALGKILQEMDLPFAYLTRGYGAKKAKTGFVIKGISNFSEVGDEPLLLSETAPVMVAKNRLQGAQIIAQNDKFKLIVMDDGMQNYSLKKDALLIIIDSQIQFGNEFLFPAGPLRERIATGLEKADLIIVVGDVNYNLQKKLAGKNYVQAKIIAKNSQQFLQKKLWAFCGLAHPEKFFSYLQNQGFNVVGSQSFPDHHLYSEIQLKQLLEKAQRNDAQLITTKKDWVKFSLQYQDKIKYLDIELEFANKGLIKNEINRILKV